MSRPRALQSSSAYGRDSEVSRVFLFGFPLRPPRVDLTCIITKAATSVPDLLRSMDVFYSGPSRERPSIGESTRRGHSKKVLRYPVRCQGYTDKSGVAKFLSRRRPSSIPARLEGKRGTGCIPEGVEMDSVGGRPKGCRSTLAAGSLRRGSLSGAGCQTETWLNYLLGMNGRPPWLRRSDLVARKKKSERSEPRWRAGLATRTLQESTHKGRSAGKISDVWIQGK